MVFFPVEAHSYCFHACSQAFMFAPTAADLLLCTSFLLLIIVPSLVSRT